MPVKKHNVERQSDQFERRQDSEEDSIHLHYLREKRTKMLEDTWQTNMKAMYLRMDHKLGVAAKERDDLRHELKKEREERCRLNRILMQQAAMLESNKKEHTENQTSMKKMIETHYAIVLKLNKRVHRQEQELEAMKDDHGTDMSDVDARIQSWVTQQSSLAQKVQENTEDLKMIRDNIQTATEEREEAYKKIEKMGETYESLFEVIRKQVESLSKERKMASRTRGFQQLEVIEERQETQLASRDAIENLHGEIETMMQASMSRFEQLEAGIGHAFKDQDLTNEKLESTLNESKEVQNALQNDLEVYKDKVNALEQQYPANAANDQSDVLAELQKLKEYLGELENEFSGSEEARRSDASKLEDLKKQVDKQHMDQDAAQESYKAGQKSLKNHTDTQVKMVKMLLELYSDQSKRAHDELKTCMEQQVAEQKNLDLKVQRKVMETRKQIETGLEDVATKMDTAGKNFERLEQQVAVHEDGLKLAKEARVVIRNDLKSLWEEMHSGSQKLTNRIEQYMEESKTVQGNFQSSLTSLDTKQRKMAAQLETSNKECTKSLKHLQDSIKRAKSDIKTLSSQLEKIQKDRVQTEISQKEFKVNAQSNLQDLSSENKKLARKIEQHSNMLKTTNEELSSAVKIFRADKTELEGKMLSLNTDVNEKGIKRFRELGTKLDQWSSKINQQIDQIKSQAYDDVMVKDELEAIRCEMDKLIQTQSFQIKHIQEHISHQIESQLTTTIEECEAQVDDLSAQIRRQAEELESVREERDSTASCVKVLFEHLNKQLESLLAQVNELADDLETARGERDEFVAKINERDQTLYRIETEMANTAKRFEESQRENTGLKTALHGLQERQKSQKCGYRERQGMLKDLIKTMDKQAPSEPIHFKPSDEDSRDLSNTARSPRSPRTPRTSHFKSQDLFPSNEGARDMSSSLRSPRSPRIPRTSHFATQDLFQSDGDARDANNTLRSPRSPRTPRTTRTRSPHSPRLFQRYE